MSKLRTKMISYDELPDPSSKGFVISTTSIELNIFLVRKNNKIFVYENSCPHTSGPLDWLPDSFLDNDNKYIICANHGALFKINNGVCVFGPCKEQSLRELPFVIDDGDIYLLT